MSAVRSIGARGRLEALQRQVLYTLGDDERLARLARRLGVAVLVALIAFVALYSYDRYIVMRPSLLSQAVAELEDAVRRAPQDPQLRLQLGHAYARQGQYERAIAQYRQVRELKNYWQPATLAIAAAELARGNATQAEGLYREVAEANRDNEFRYVSRDMQTVYYRLGQLALSAGRAGEAADWARDVLRGNQSDADALFLLGRAEEAQGNVQAAREAYRRAAGFDPDFREAFMALERVAAGLGDGREASYARGMALLAAKDAAGALAEFRRLAAEAPDYAEAYLGLGLALDKQGQRAEAIKAFQAALERAPELRLAQWSLRALEEER